MQLLHTARGVPGMPSCAAAETLHEYDWQRYGSVPFALGFLLRRV